MKSTLARPIAGPSRFCRGLAGCVLMAVLTLLQPADARDLLQPADEGLLRIEVQTCQLLCGRDLAQCERERLRGIRCPRDYQFCREDCQTMHKPLLTAAQRQERLCTQRCETSAALCEQQIAINDASCRGGLSQCVARC